MMGSYFYDRKLFSSVSGGFLGDWCKQINMGDRDCQKLMKIGKLMGNEKL